MKLCLIKCLVTVLVVAAGGLQSLTAAEVRVKDITNIHGDRVNQLKGLGLVAGLAGTGGESPVTRQFALNVEQRLGLRADPAVRALLDFDQQRRTDNLSVVMVTADLRSFAREGSQIDVSVSAWDDAESLQGGILIQTPLYGADGKVYAVASGAVSTGGFSFTGNAGAVTQNHPNSGRITNGATVELETTTPVGQNGKVELVLQQPDFETARRIKLAINALYSDSCRVPDPGTVEVRVPELYRSRVSEWIGRIGAVTVKPDVKAKVIINERTGTVVVGTNVRLSRVLITHANLTVTTAESADVSQPAPLSDGETVVVPQTEVNVPEEGIPVSEIEPNVTVGQLAASLNALGVSPKDLSSIFQQLKASGALHAELELK